jgi:two-component system, NarL family, sensor histidine kinase UhpB
MWRSSVAFVFALGLSASTSVQASPSDTGPLLGGTRAVALGVAVVTVLLSVLLYLLPLRAAAVAKRRTETAMSERVLTLQEEDRRRIARELHDGAGQALTAARLQLIALRAVEGVPRDLIQSIAESIDSAIDEIRRSTSALAPPALAELGLLGALTRHCDGFASASGLEVRLDASSGLPSLPAYVETTLYRIVQEGLTNAARHAGATRVWVTVASRGEGVQLEVGDDGAGIATARPGFGLESIGERARLAGGKLELMSDSGPGPRLRVTIPIALGAA